MISSGASSRAWLTGDQQLVIAGLVISGGIVGGMFLGSATLTLVAAYSAFLAGLVFPEVGLVVLAFMGPLRPPLAIPAPGFNLILVITILLGCLYRLPISRARLSLSPPLLFLSAFVLYIFVQQLPDMATGYAGDRSHEIGFLFFQLLTGLGTVFAAGFVLRGRSPYPFLLALLLSVTFAALLGILTADGDPYPRLKNLLSPSDVGSRTAGPFGNPNAYGQLLAYGTALAAGWFATSHSLSVRAALAAAAGIMVYAISLSLSRGAIATLLIGVVVLAFARSRTVGLAAMGTALVVVLIGYPLFLEERLTADTGSATTAAEAQLAQSDEGRLGAVLAGPALFATSPIFGIGFGEYKYVSALVTNEGAGLVGHNWYGTILAEQGLLGIGLWLLALLTAFRWLGSRPARPRSIGFTLFGAVLVGCLFLSVPPSFQLSVLPVIVLAGALVGDWGGGPITPRHPARKALDGRSPGRRGVVSNPPIGEGGYGV